MFSLMWIFIIILCITLILMLINYLITIKKIMNREKSSPFECGFDPLNSPRLPFSIQFYLISIIFLIFDIEIIILLPLIPSMNQTNWFSWMNLSSYFIFILILGLYIEWNDGALEWLK